jgi:hypothetical protein
VPAKMRLPVAHYVGAIATAPARAISATIDATSVVKGFLAKVCIDEIAQNLRNTHAPLEEDEFGGWGGPHRPIAIRRSGS